MENYIRFIHFKKELIESGEYTQFGSGFLPVVIIVSQIKLNSILITSFNSKSDNIVLFTKSNSIGPTI